MRLHEARLLANDERALLSIWHWWCALSGTDRAKIILEIIGIGVVAAYTTVAAGQLRATLAANKNATSALHVSERAYITTDGPVFDATTKFVTISLNNDGHVPCPYSETVAHEATFNTWIPNTPPLITDAIESHWKSHKGPIPPGKNLMKLLIPVPAFSAAEFTPEFASQEIVIAGWITYGDGFPDDGPQKWEFCFRATIS